MNQSRLFVGNLPYSTSDQDLGEMFSAAGNVIKATVMRDQATGRSRGFAFVEMSCDEDAQAAIDRLNDSSVGGRQIKVSVARPRENYGSRNGGGRDSYRGRREPRW